MQKLIEAIDYFLSRFLILLMALIVLAVTWQVFTRFIVKDPSSFTEELARFLLIWIGVLGASYALRTRSHLGIDLITERVGPQGKMLLQLFVYVVIIIFSIAVMIVGGISLVDLTFTLNQTSAALGIKMGYVYSVIPLSGLLMVLYSVYFMWEAISTSTRSAEGEG